MYTYLDAYHNGLTQLGGEGGGLLEGDSWPLDRQMHKKKVIFYGGKLVFLGENGICLPREY